MNQVDAFLQKQIEDNNTPSVQYIIFNKDKVIHRFKNGFTDIESQKKVEASTTYHAFSVTKTFTALAVMQLAEKKLLVIDDPVKKYLPDFPYAPEITIHQLLTHSAGIPNPIPLSWIHLTQDHPSFNRNKFFNQLIVKNNKVKSTPNQKYSYSNLGYVILGQLIEKVSGMTYEECITKNILEKIELHPDDLGFSIYPNGELAKGYHKRFSFSNFILSFLIDKSKFMDNGRGKWQAFKDYYINGAYYGGLIGTPDSFVKYIQELLKSNCKLIADNFKEMLFRENDTMDNKATGMCLSWFCGQLNGEKYLAHAGGGGGYYCEIRLYPAVGVGSVIMFNRTGMTDERFLNKTDKYFINEKRSRLSD